ncbi:MAG: 4Fe-4S binding protein [Bacteroides sp.]|nr:4Fe-4S binding protein [Bacteroides sp.]MCM1379187.1 4Fe-4S binding protein [Bacteroides sp.]MCM1445164.1 4Fe-4S binding protein [Prevotella sp.]
MSELTQNRGQGWLMLLRVTVEAGAAFFVTASLLNYGVRCTAVGRWIGGLQLVSAALMLALPVLALWLAVTLMFGRLYCSTVCPLGALIDLGARVRPSSKVYRYRRGLTAVRWLSMAVGAVALVVATPFARAWLEPYGLYGSLVRSVADGRSLVAAAVAALIAGVLMAVAYRRGRWFCNSVCPLSAPLGFLGRSAAFHIDINTDMCVQCRRCVDVCKAECINLDDHVADMSRCVVCFNCLPVCPNDAISYTLSRHALSTPLMQKILKNDKTPSLTCNNTSTSCRTSSTTESSKPTEPARER